jgi:hypothetical protein
MMDRHQLQDRVQVLISVLKTAEILIKEDMLTIFPRLVISNSEAKRSEAKQSKAIATQAVCQNQNPKLDELRKVRNMDNRSTHLTTEPHVRSATMPQNHLGDYTQHTTSSTHRSLPPTTQQQKLHPNPLCLRLSSPPSIASPVGKIPEIVAHHPKSNLWAGQKQNPGL